MIQKAQGELKENDDEDSDEESDDDESDYGDTDNENDEPDHMLHDDEDLEAKEIDDDELGFVEKKKTKVASEEDMEETKDDYNLDKKEDNDENVYESENEFDDCVSSFSYSHPNTLYSLI